MLLLAGGQAFGSIYDNIPALLPASMISQSFQAGRISEFGDLVSFAGTDRALSSVTLAAVTWGYFSKYNSADTVNTGGWTDPGITVNLYTVDNSGEQPAPGSLLGSVTQSFFIPWRPEPSASCPGTEWLASDGCHNGMAFEITLDFSSLNLVLPDQIIFGIAYDTQSAGQSATGVVGPYNDLNVGLNAKPSIGSVPNAPAAYLSGTIAESYADNGAGGINVFRLDTGGTHTPVAIEFDTVPEPGTAAMAIGGALLLAGQALRLRRRGNGRPA